MKLTKKQMAALAPVFQAMRDHFKTTAEAGCIIIQPFHTGEMRCARFSPPACDALARLLKKYADSIHKVDFSTPKVKAGRKMAGAVDKKAWPSTDTGCRCFGCVNRAAMAMKTPELNLRKSLHNKLKE